ncbi:hypothetical protein EOB59_31600 [Mesorhizobium sp. M7A.F.Ca.MR.176.00.0.0]|uniref:hypothetical protein n=1 Tax=Mesorhizobium sp. M7A.F.Ca.MR.176.00.0.0 TaxID=2496776 RepID=UPI000FD374E4|nr:hypothetical protein [Mesorhizobium sp. M7A.F.Ca.MR.176.00.0.0]RUU85603.1 hypothetical protein EOB59_31600 [Mesorhizobium sp. M7A.F.Ca.MR.176.00.0.0]
MPRVAPIVRSTRYEHAINTLVAKRSEISGAIRFKGADLADQLQHIDAVLLILGYKGDPSLIVPLRRTPSRFRKGELYGLILKHEAAGSASNRETATRIVQAKGWDTAFVKPIMNNIKTAKGWRRRKAKAAGHDSRPQE